MFSTFLTRGNATFQLQVNGKHWFFPPSMFPDSWLISSLLGICVRAPGKVLCNQEKVKTSHEGKLQLFLGTNFRRLWVPNPKIYPSWPECPSWPEAAGFCQLQTKGPAGITQYETLSGYHSWALAKVSHCKYFLN